MYRHIVTAAAITVLIVATGLSLFPVNGATDTDTETPEIVSEPIMTEHDQTTTPDTYGDCTLVVWPVDKSNVNVVHSERYEDLPTNQKRIYDGEGNADNWNTDVKYVEKDGNWTKTQLACP